MTRTQIQQLVVILLLILFVGVFLLNKKGPEPGKPAGDLTPGSSAALEIPEKPTEPPAPAPETLADLNVPRDVFLLPTLLLQRLEQRDREAAEIEERKKHPNVQKPQTISPGLQGPVTNLELQGIFWGVAKPEAIINRKIVSVGDSVEDAEVEAITRDSVTLSKDGQKIELKPTQRRTSH